MLHTGPLSCLIILILLFINASGAEITCSEEFFKASIRYIDMNVSYKNIHYFPPNVWSGCESTVTNTRLVKPSQVLRGRHIADGYMKLQLVWRQKFLMLPCVVRKRSRSLNRSKTRTEAAAGRGGDGWREGVTGQR